MKKKAVSVFFAVCLAVLLLPFQVFALQDSGDNGSAAGAQNFTPGETITGSISEDGDLDFYRFTLSESGRVSLDFTSYMEYYALYLYDTAGNELFITENNQWNETMGYRQDAYTVDLEAGTYFIRVSGYQYSWSGTSATGNYSLQTGFTASGANEQEPNNSAAAANTMSFGSTARGLIGLNDNYDFYRIDLSESGRLTLDITVHMEYYALYLYDHMGSTLWSTNNNYWNETMGLRQDVHTIDLEAGTYYLEVSGYQYDWSSNYATGTYAIAPTFTASGANQPEPNDSAAQAVQVSTESMITGLIARNDAYDFYTFTLSANETLPLQVTSYMEYYSVYIYNPAGEEVWSTTGNYWNETVGSRSDAYEISLDAGTYYLRISGHQYSWSSEYATGVYNLSFGAVRGDVDGNGRVDIQDVMATCKILARSNAGETPTATELQRGDMNGNGAIAIDDVMAICKLLAQGAR